MAFRDFTMERLEQDFHITVQDVQGLFSATPPAPVEEWLRQFLAENVPMATAINTEKARSEFIIAPVLSELRKIRKRQMALFSGIELNVDSQVGLNGVCDFLISATPSQLFLRRPVVAVVEAKREDINGGIPQCLAEMIAIHRFNMAGSSAPKSVFGAVSSGTVWKFLRLVMPVVSIDLNEYLIDDVDKILGILNFMVGESPGA